jgi:hypothetical protein
MSKKRKNMEIKGAQAEISVKNKDKTEQETVEKVGDDVLFEDPPCNVGVTAGMTINLGDYNSAKVQVSIHIPCKHEEIEEAYEFGRDWVEGKVTELVEQIKED